jgi:serine/threonine protein kinase
LLAPGTSVGDRYVLREPVARGGMGEVWRADDLVLGRTVAVKVLLPSLSGDPGFAERFRTEARAMAALSDPRIVEVYDYGQADGIAYLVMPFITGESLHELLNRAGPLPPREAMTIVAQAANALQLAHQSGIVHRDVKPGNLLLRPDGRLVLTDFGIARIDAADQVTGADVAIGTAAYLAPEQISGNRVAPATDIYSLGVVAYECLTLTRPFDADSSAGVALIHTRDEPPPLPDTIPPPVRQVVMRALAKDPEQRWPSAHAMAQAATTAARELPEQPWFAAPEAPPRRPAPPPTPPRAPRARGRRSPPSWASRDRAATCGHGSSRSRPALRRLSRRRSLPSAALALPVDSPCRRRVASRPAMRCSAMPSSRSRTSRKLAIGMAATMAEVAMEAGTAEATAVVRKTTPDRADLAL